MQLAPVESIFRVGKRKCHMTLKNGVIDATWEPNMPKRLTKKELRQYREGRDNMIAELAAQSGLKSALVIEA